MVDKTEDGPLGPPEGSIIHWLQREAREARFEHTPKEIQTGVGVGRDLANTAIGVLQGRGLVTVRFRGGRLRRLAYYSLTEFRDLWRRDRPNPNSE